MIPSLGKRVRPWGLYYAAFLGPVLRVNPVVPACMYTLTLSVTFIAKNTCISQTNQLYGSSTCLPALSCSEPLLLLQLLHSLYEEAAF